MSYAIDRYPCEEWPRLGTMTLHPVAESVPRARRWFRKFLTPYQPICSVEDCVLLLSELVTNAVVHGKSDAPWLVRVEWFRLGSLAPGRGAQSGAPGKRATEMPRRRRRARTRPAAGRLRRRFVALRPQHLRRNGRRLHDGRGLAAVVLKRRTHQEVAKGPLPGGETAGRGPTRGRLLLLALGLAGDLGELHFRCSGAVGPCAWWSLLVVIGHCQATSYGPGTAQLCRALLTASTFGVAGPNLSRRQSATTAGALTDQARVCLVAPPPESATLLMPSTRVSRDGRSDDHARALMPASRDHLPVSAERRWTEPNETEACWQPGRVRPSCMIPAMGHELHSMRASDWMPSVTLGIRHADTYA